MSSGDFEAQVRQSVADHLALIQTAATAAKARIVTSVQQSRAPAAEPAFEQPSTGRPRPAVDFFAEEPAFSEESAFAEASAFSETSAFADQPASSALPEGAISFDDLALENLDDDGVPVWEDPP